MKKFLIILLSIIALPLSAETTDSIADITDMEQEETEIEKPKKNFIKKVIDLGEKVFDYVNDVDTLYIRPQEYNWAVMVQATTNLESYKFQSPTGESISFSPEARTKIGPYAGWRWAFLGYTFDVKKLHITERVDIDFSLYSPIFNIDLIWRESGKSYKIRDASVDTNYGTKKFHDLSFPGIDTYIRGLNFYYVLKHRRFSYPAAFAQSSCQLRSAGSPIVGISYMHHRLNYDNEQLISTLNGELAHRFPEANCTVNLDSTFNFNKIEHAALTLSGGYAHNQVLAKHLIFASSLTAGIGFKRSIGDKYERGFSYEDFKLKNINFDGCGRFAIVYNNMKWYAGTSAILHYYSYNKGAFHTANWFATINLYAGFNFGKRKK